MSIRNVDAVQVVKRSERQAQQVGDEIEDQAERMDPSPEDLFQKNEYPSQGDLTVLNFVTANVEDSDRNFDFVTSMLALWPDAVMSQRQRQALAKDVLGIELSQLEEMIEHAAITASEMVASSEEIDLEEA
jgi:hypothetical protein